MALEKSLVSFPKRCLLPPSTSLPARPALCDSGAFLLHTLVSHPGLPSASLGLPGLSSNVTSPGTIPGSPGPLFLCAASGAWATFYLLSTFFLWLDEEPQKTTGLHSIPLCIPNTLHCASHIVGAHGSISKDGPARS